MAKTTKFAGVMENWSGRKLTELKLKSGEYNTVPKFTYEAEFDELEKGEEIPAKEMPDAEGIRNLVNSKRKAAARQKAMQATMDLAEIVRPDIKNDEQLRLEKFYELMVANGSTEAEAKAQASAVLGIAWRDSE
jgi:hypothetical protein